MVIHRFGEVNPTDPFDLSHAGVVDPNQRLNRIAERQDALFSLRQALGAGLSWSTIERRLGSEDFKLWLPGVYSRAGVPETWPRRVMAAILATKGRGLASRTSAVFLMCLGDVSQPDRIDITVPRGRYPKLPVGVHTSMTLQPDDYDKVGCIPVTAVERCMVDLAACTGSKILLSCLNHVLVEGLTTVARITAKLEQMGGVPGRKRIAGLLGRADPDLAKHDSQLERRVLRAMLTGGLPRPEINENVYDDHGQVVARPDMSYPRFKVAIEAHSRRYHATLLQQEADAERQRKLEALGWIVSYVTHEELRDPVVVCQRIREAIAIQSIRLGIAV